MTEQARTPVQAQPKETSPAHSTLLQRVAVTPVHSPVLQRCTTTEECAECHQRRLATIQRAAVSAAPVNAVPPIVHEVLNSPGQSLDAGMRAFMEPRFGHDFSQVRVHTDARAAESARAVNALAYTVGRNVVFGAGQYVPGTNAGKRLLAHELTHVVQQRVALFEAPFKIGEIGSQTEREAEAVAGTSFSATPLKIIAHTPSTHLHRQLGTATHRGRFDTAQEAEAVHYTLAQGYDASAIRLIQRVVGTGDDGVYGGDSVEKVGQWQSTHGLAVDGKVGPKTLWSIIVELRTRGQDVDARYLAQFVNPSRRFVSNVAADVTTLASGAPPTAPDVSETQADAFLASLGLLTHVTKLGPPSNRYDCHGYTFLAGAAWINDDQVDTILADNGYAVTTAPAVGDIVVYRLSGSVTHSGIITAVSGGVVTQVHSKWGRLGLYSHAPNDVPPTYGTWQAYHSSRPGSSLLRPHP